MASKSRFFFSVIGFISKRMDLLENQTVAEELEAVLSRVQPRVTELNDRPLPGLEDCNAASEFGTRYSTGVDCDFVFRDSILVGNL